MRQYIDVSIYILYVYKYYTELYPYFPQHPYRKKHQLGISGGQSDVRQIRLVQACRQNLSDL